MLVVEAAFGLDLDALRVCPGCGREVLWVELEGVRFRPMCVVSGSSKLKLQLSASCLGYTCLDTSLVDGARGEARDNPKGR